jgi:acyl transferase domain-containing protein/acyl carrier protein
MATDEELRNYLRRAVVDLADVRRRLADAEGRLGEVEESRHDPIAIVGMGCRFPGGVSTPEQLWDLVNTRQDVIGTFPTDRGWDPDLYDPDPEVSGKTYSQLGGFIYEAPEFDAGVFGMSPRAALATDPAHRMLLEICWEVFERAGIDPTALRGSRTGVYAGCMYDYYATRFLNTETPESVDGSLHTANLQSVLSGRVSYTFGLEGPAVTVDTACSTSLVAIHLAVQALRRGECSLALAGGVTVMADPIMFVEFSRQRGLALDGRCKAFSEAADGTSWAEGGGMLLLERLSDAQRNGRQILAVIRGSAINQDGRSNGMTAPNGPSQERVIWQALADARLDARDVDAVEAHGTGTKLGDPIEAQALLATYGRHRDADRPLWLGSLKSNLGHTQAAAGVGGIIKMVLAMRHGVLPATLHADQPSSYVDWSAGTVELLTEPVAWSHPDRPVRAAVSAFGISGTNGHVIVEGPPEPVPTAELAEPEASHSLVWVVSARTSQSLRSQAARLLDYASTAEASDLAAAGQVLAGRARLMHRAVVVATDRDELLAGLAAVAGDTPHPAAVVGTAEDVSPVFVFPGQGTQWAGMAVELLDSHELFRDELRRCDEALAVHTGWSVMAVLREQAGAPALAGSAVVQPVLFAVMVSLAALWRSAGVEPSAVLGHSQGEIAAACVAGALSLEDAARIVALRSKALTRLRGTGGMLAVALGADQARQRMEPWQDRLWIAVHSSPTGVVLAGEVQAIEEFAAELGEAVRTRRIEVDYASHTPHIEKLRSELFDLLAGITPAAVDVRFCSSLTGSFLPTTELSTEYWYDNLRQPVRFRSAVAAFAEDAGSPLFIEVSPHPVLAGDLRDIIHVEDIPGAVCETLRRGAGNLRQFLLAAAQAYVLGATLDWKAVLGRAPNRRLDVPTYAFDRRRYWLDNGARVTAAAAGIGPAAHPLLNALVSEAGGGFLLTGQLSMDSAPWLADHEVDGVVLFPGAGLVELALAAATAAGCSELEELTLHAPLVLPGNGSADVQVRVDRAEAGRRALTLYSRSGSADWSRCASGAVIENSPAGSESADWASVWPPAGATALDVGKGYAELANRGYGYGPAFQGLVAAWQRGDELFGEVLAPDGIEATGFGIHPALLDAALHPLVLTAETEELRLPFVFRGVRLSAVGATALRVRLTSSGADSRIEAADVFGAPVLRVESLRARTVSSDALRAGEAVGLTLQGIDWIDVAPAGLLHARWISLGEKLRGMDGVSSLAELAEYEVVPEFVVLSCPAGDLDSPATAARELTIRVLATVREWLAEQRFAGSRLIVLTGSADLAGAAVSGLVRSAAAEHPGRFGQIEGDVSALAHDSALSDGLPVVAGLMADGDWQLAVRGNRVLAPRLVALTSKGDAVSLAEGTVLVTGGTGGLGAIIAERLVSEHGVRRLELVSRRGPAADGVDELTERLQAAGAQVRVTACDVSNRASLAAVLAGIPVDRPLTGVVHAAGLLADAPIDRLTSDQVGAVFAPKADAAWNLHELTAETPLSAFVMFSSLAGVLGNAGQGNYAAANAFADALVAHRRERGLPGVSIAWGLWDVPTGLTGALSPADVARLARAGVAPLSARQGVELFDQALSGTAPVVVAAAWDATGLRGRADAGTLAPVLRSLVRTPRRAAAQHTAATSEVRRSSDSEVAQRLAGLSEADAREALTDLVRAQVATVLGLPDTNSVSAGQAFSELGFDSLTVVELRNRLDAATGLRLPATLAFDYPTVKSLAQYLQRTLAPRAVPVEETLRANLDQLEQLLPEGNEAVRAKVIAILNSALLRLEATPSGPSDVHDQIRSASDDEIFALIDNGL